LVATFTLEFALTVAVMTQFLMQPRLIVATAVVLLIGTSAFYWSAGRWFLSGVAFVNLGLMALIGLYAQSRTRALLKRAVDETSARLREAEAANREVRVLNEELRRQIADRARQLADALTRLAAAPAGPRAP